MSRETRRASVLPILLLVVGGVFGGLAALQFEAGNALIGVVLIVSALLFVGVGVVATARARRIVRSGEKP